MAARKSTRKFSHKATSSLGTVPVDVLFRMFPPAEGEMEKIEAQQMANERRALIQLPHPITKFDNGFLTEMGIRWWDQVPTDDSGYFCGHA